MKRWILIFAVLLVACGGTPETAALPALPPEPTKVPLEAIELEPLLIQSGDLPAGLTGAQVLDTQPPAYEQMSMPPATKLIFQRFAKGSAPGGYVVVSLYKDAAQLDTAYAALDKDLHAVGVVTTPTEVGEIGVLSVDNLFGAHFGFRRCAALVNIMLVGADGQSVLAYAKRLEKRLQPLVCTA